MLEITGLDVHFGGIHALKGVTLEVGEGEIVTLIGSNGAGKSTTLRTISGLTRATAGTITLDGTDITRLSAQGRVRRGISQVPEGRRVFATMTVQENLELGAYLRRSRGDKAALAADYDAVFDRFPVLAERRRQSAGTLSGGEQQMLAMGRAMMARPRVLLLDEPSMGLAPLLVQEIFDIIGRFNAESSTTILLVEQNANMALQVAHRGYVIETGRIVLSGPAADLAGSDDIRKAYLGG